MEKTLSVFNGNASAGSLSGSNYVAAFSTVSVDLGEASPTVVVEFSVPLDSSNNFLSVPTYVSWSRDGVNWTNTNQEPTFAFVSPTPDSSLTTAGLLYLQCWGSVRYMRVVIQSNGYQNPDSSWNLGGGPMNINVVYFADSSHVPGDVRVALS